MMPVESRDEEQTKPVLAKKVFLLVVLCIAVAFAETNVSYSGTYVAQHKGKPDGENTVLRVVQTESAIEVAVVQSDKVASTRFPLDGTASEYTSPDGVRRTAKALFKGKNLILESVAFTRPNPNGPTVRVRTRERWQLSADAQTLTIKTEVDFPDTRLDIAAAALPTNSSIHKYQRVDTQ